MYHLSFAVKLFAVISVLMLGCSDDQKREPFDLAEDMKVAVDAARDEGTGGPVVEPDVPPDLVMEDMDVDLGPVPTAQLKIIHALNHDKFASAKLSINGKPLNITLSHAHGTGLIDVPAGDVTLSITSTDDPQLTQTFEAKELVADQRYVAVMAGIRDGTVPNAYRPGGRDLSPEVFWIEGLKTEGDFPFTRDAHFVYAAPENFLMYTSLSGIDTTMWPMLAWGILRPSYEKISTKTLALSIWGSPPFTATSGYLSATIPRGNGGRSIIVVLDGILSDTTEIRDLFPGGVRLYTAEEGPGILLDYSASLQVVRTAASSPKLVLEEDVVMDGLEQYKTTQRGPVPSGQGLSLDIVGGNAGQLARLDLEPFISYVGIWTNKAGQDQLVVVPRPPERVDATPGYKLVIFNDVSQTGSLMVDVEGRSLEAPAKTLSSTLDGVTRVDNNNTLLIRDPAVADDPGESVLLRMPSFDGVCFLVIVPSTRPGARWDVLEVGLNVVRRFPE